MNDFSKARKKPFRKPELIKYGSLEETTLVSNPSSQTNTACSTGTGCATMFTGTLFPQFCSGC